MAVERYCAGRAYTCGTAHQGGASGNTWIHMCVTKKLTFCTIIIPKKSASLIGRSSHPPRCLTDALRQFTRIMEMPLHLSACIRPCFVVSTGRAANDRSTITQGHQPCARKGFCARDCDEQDRETSRSTHRTELELLLEVAEDGRKG